MARPLHIAIIGGRFSSMLAAIHWERNSSLNSTSFTLVNTTPYMVWSLAYQFDDDSLLQNVPSGKMSELTDEPGYFVAYCQRIDSFLSLGSLVSRLLYGQHLQSFWSHILGESKWDLEMTSGERLIADRVVLVPCNQRHRFHIPMYPELHLHTQHFAQTPLNLS